MHSVDYMLSQDIHLSVRPSVTRRYFVEMGKHILKLLPFPVTLSDS